MDPLKQRDITAVSDAPSVFGCEPLFDMGADEALMSLSFEGTAPFLDWLGWEKTDVCNIKKYFINFVRAEANAQGTKTSGYLGDACADPNGIEFDLVDFSLTDFGRLRRGSPTRDITKSALKAWQAQPRYRLDGSPITNEREFDLRLATEVVMLDLKELVITGNASTAGQFDGLQNLVKTGYASSNGNLAPMMDSIVVDWNGNSYSGGNGITWNGAAVASTYGLIDVIHAIFRRIRHRIRMAPALAAQKLAEGDIILVLPDDFCPSILDAFTCWSVCDGDYNRLNTLEARAFRSTLNGGMFGAGTITIDGFKIPLLPYDFGLINSGQTFDMYMLTGSVGNMKVLHGQYNDLAVAQTERNDKFFATDGGRLLTWPEDKHTCEIQVVEMQPRIVGWAPWAEARIQDIVMDVPGGIISADPWNTYFPY